MEGYHRWLETAHNFKGYNVNRGSFLKSWCTMLLCLLLRLQSIFFFLANIFDYLAYLN